MNSFALLDGSKPKASKPTPKAAAKSDAKRTEAKQAASAEKTAALERELFSAPNFSTSNWADDDTEDEDEGPPPVDDGWSRVPGVSSEHCPTHRRRLPCTRAQCPDPIPPPSHGLVQAIGGPIDEDDDDGEVREAHTVVVSWPPGLGSHAHAPPPPHPDRTAC
jgi:hypothetical protein